MPNPLTLISAAPSTAAKPAAAQWHDVEAEMSTDFQGVLALETSMDSADAETTVPPLTDVEIEPAEVDAAPVPDAVAETQPVEGAEVPVAAPQINEQHPEAQVPVEAAMAHGQAWQAIPQNQPPADTPASAHTQSATPLIVDPPQTRAPQGPKVELGVVRKKPLPVGAPEGSIPDVDARPGGPQISTTPARPPKVALSAPPPTAAQMQLTASLKSAETEDAPQVTETEGLNTARSEPPSQQSRDIALQPNAASAVARAEISRAIAGQMAAAITARPGSGTVEIALNPEELGRVSIVLNGRDDGLHLAIVADRPETLDLMRRHISVLTAEFQKLGFGDMSLDLGTSTGSHQDHPESQPGQVFETDFTEASVPTYPQRSTPGTGIDMRL